MNKDYGRINLTLSLSLSLSVSHMGAVKFYTDVAKIIGNGPHSAMNELRFLINYTAHPQYDWKRCALTRGGRIQFTLLIPKQSDVSQK